jgi:ZIP family zinc transporter
MTWLLVLAGALVTALATGLGALPLASRRIGEQWLGAGHAVAAGFMIGASAILLRDGAVRDAPAAAFGALAGLALILIASRLAHEDEERLFASLAGANARKALLFVAIMTAHSAAEGVGLGVSFGQGQHFGWAITILLALHNIPEGLAIALIMVPAGASVASAARWSIISSLPQPLIAVPAFLFVTAFAPALPWGLGIAGGAMLWMALTHLVPDSAEHMGWRGAVLLTSAAAIISGVPLLMLS